MHKYGIKKVDWRQIIRLVLETIGSKECVILTGFMYSMLEQLSVGHNYTGFMSFTFSLAREYLSRSAAQTLLFVIDYHTAGDHSLSIRM